MALAQWTPVIKNSHSLHEIKLEGFEGQEEQISFIFDSLNHVIMNWNLLVFAGVREVLSETDFPCTPGVQLSGWRLSLLCLSCSFS